MENTTKLYHAGAEIYGFYIKYQNGTISDNNGKYYKSIEEANFYCGLSDIVLPKIQRLNIKPLRGQGANK